MYKICKTELSNKRQREIEDLLLKLMLKKHYDDISVTEICDGANIPRKCFYRYFDGKDGAMHALLYHKLSDFSSFRLALQNDNERKLKEEFENLFLFWKENKELLEAFDKSGLIGLLIEEATSYGMEEFGDVKKYMSDSDDREKAVAYQFVICGLMTITINWYRSGFVESVSNLARFATKIITRPLFENLSRTE